MYIFDHACPTTCAILVPQPGTESAPLALEVQSLTTALPGKSQNVTFKCNVVGETFQKRT